MLGRHTFARSGSIFALLLVIGISCQKALSSFGKVMRCEAPIGKRGRPTMVCSECGGPVARISGCITCVFCGESECEGATFT